MILFMADGSGLATERMHVSVVRVERQGQRVSFRALEVDMLVVIEADNEDDARALCAEAGLQFLTLCDD
jgi:hypothetical protein